MGQRADIDEALLGNTDLIVTTTGNADVCDKNMLATVKAGAVVVNIGHFDNEIDTAYAGKLALGGSEAPGPPHFPQR